MKIYNHLQTLGQSGFIPLMASGCIPFGVQGCICWGKALPGLTLPKHSRLPGWRLLLLQPEYNLER